MARDAKAELHCNDVVGQSRTAMERDGFGTYITPSRELGINNVGVLVPVVYADPHL